MGGAGAGGGVVGGAPGAPDRLHLRAVQRLRRSRAGTRQTLLASRWPPANPGPAQGVLYGIFAAAAAGAGLSAARLWWLRRPLGLLRAARDDPEAARNLRGVYRFKSISQVGRGGGGGGAGRCFGARASPSGVAPRVRWGGAAGGRGAGPQVGTRAPPHLCPAPQTLRQVEVLSRVMRKWDDDGVPDEEASAIGEFIYKARGEPGGGAGGGDWGRGGCKGRMRVRRAADGSGRRRAPAPCDSSPARTLPYPPAPPDLQHLPLPSAACRGSPTTRCC
jgi:hypothetical protein